MLYNIRYWWFFLSQGNQWTKYLAHPKIQRSKPCLLILASLVALDSFHLLQSTQLTADLTLEWSYCIETAANNALNRRCIVVFDRLQNCEYTVFWYLQLLCYLVQLQFTIGQNEFVEFFGVFQENYRIWVTWELSIICVCTTAFKVSIQPFKVVSDRAASE